MTATRHEQPPPGRDRAADGHAGLDNLTLARKEGWRSFVDAPARSQPEALTTKDLRRLGEDEVADYNQGRRVWHANLGPIRTPQLAELHEDLWDIVDSNAQDGDKAKGAIAIDAFPGLGKTTSVLAFAKQFHLRELDAAIQARRLTTRLTQTGRRAG